KDLAILTRQFASMTSAGLSILRSLAILEDQVQKSGLKSAIGRVRADVRHGATLSAALANHPDHFPSLMVNMIKAGETGGFLDDALSRIATMYEADSELRSKIKGAMTYPLIVLAFSLLMGGAVIVFIVPIFERMFSQLGGELPAPTQFLVTLSHNAVWGGPLLVVLVIGGFSAFKKAYRGNKGFRLAVDKAR